MALKSNFIIVMIYSKFVGGGEFFLILLLGLLLNIKTQSAEGGIDNGF